MKWQRRARIVIAAVAVACVIAVWAALRPRTVTRAEPPVARTDPKAVVESGASQTLRFNREHEESHHLPEAAHLRRWHLADGRRERGDRTGRRTHVHDYRPRGPGRQSAVDGHADRRCARDGERRARALDRPRHLHRVGRHGSRPRRGAILARPDERLRRRLHVSEERQRPDDRRPREAKVAPDDEGGGALQAESGTLQFMRNDKVLRFDRTFKALRDRQSSSPTWRSRI